MKASTGRAKKYGRIPLASSSFRFLRPFNGCVPQPEKKRRLFDSHNPNSLMVAELGRTISKSRFERNTPFVEKQKNVSSLCGNELSFPLPHRAIAFKGVKYQIIKPFGCADRTGILQQTVQFPSSGR
jgi:hypothetical protein